MIASFITMVVLLIHATTLCLLLLMTVRVMRNLAYFWWVRKPAHTTHIYPRVSILVPARNEERAIRASLESLAVQEYPDFEILVLDDQSTDGTLAQIEQVIARYPTIHILHGSHAPPEGWNGKSYACHRLAEQASGEWLLFTDADTIHTPASIRQGIQQATKLNADLLSAMPRQIAKTWSERLLVSFIMDFLPLLGIDLHKVTRQQHSSAIANGQYILVRESTYHELGGHAAIGEALVDDFALANHFMRHNRRVAIINGQSMVSCRMYQNAGELWRGFSKNIVLSLQTARRWQWWSALLFAWGFVALFVWPYVFLLANSTIWLALLEIGWLSVLRLMIGYEFRRPLVEALLTPASAIGVMILGLNALLLKYTNHRIVWKDRPYPLS